jgi:hypothetical protein
MFWKEVIRAGLLPWGFSGDHYHQTEISQTHCTYNFSQKNTLPTFLTCIIMYTYGFFIGLPPKNSMLNHNSIAVKLLGKSYTYALSNWATYVAKIRKKFFTAPNDMRNIYKMK